MSALDQTVKHDAKFSLNVHAQITKAANEIIKIFDDTQLADVITANMSQDIHQTESWRHFDNCDFSGSLDYINSQWDVIEEIQKKYDMTSLGSFGFLLHTTQDFYAHSNYIELNVNNSPIPVWNQDLSTLPAGIYSGVWWMGRPKMCAAGTPSHDQLNKDSPTSPEGSKVVTSGPNTGETLFTLAYNAAVAATVVQFQRYQALPTAVEALAHRTEGDWLIQAAAAFEGLRGR